MPPVLLRAARLLTPVEEICDGALLIEGGKIAAVGPREAMNLPPGATETNLGERIVIPGFVDVHIHGAGGYDVMEATPDALAAITRSISRRGTTTILATTVTASVEDTQKSLSRLASYIASSANHTPGRAEIAGIHMEGPFISTARRGVHPAEHIIPPSLLRFCEMAEAAGGHAKILTLAPERPGALEVIEGALQLGVVVSMGHTDATFDEAHAAIEHGVRHATHVFNAMRPLQQRDSGVLGAVLTDQRVTAELIADGIHVDAGAMGILLAAKGAAEIILVSDGTSATGMPDGNYRLGTLSVNVSSGVCRDAEGRLAGSTLTLDRAARRMVSIGVPLVEAVRMATSQPAARIGLVTKGVLAVGADADFVVLTPELEIERVASRGEWVD
jgi:N-acetylglucosamine-6-phosphate deacetylase